MSRRYEDVVPPGTEQPPVPGMEPSPRFEDRYQYDKEHRASSPIPKEPEEKKDRKHRHSHTPEKQTSPKKTRERHETPERHSKRKKRDDSSDRENKRESDKDKHRKDGSDDEKLRKSKDKKRRKEKKEAERKKRKEKKEKRERKAEEKKVKEEKKAKEKEDVEEEQQVKVKEPKEVKKEEKPVKEPKEKSPIVEKSPKVSEEPKPDLYGDILTEGIDTKVVESYGKIEENKAEAEKEEPEQEIEQGEITEREEGETSKEYEDSEKDILELHTNEAELKLEKNEILAPLPEKSKWELDEENAHTSTTPTDSSRSDSKPEKHAKVTNEVLKRAENAIFAKAINAIRPIEIKKISTDRAKLYSGERDRKMDELPSHHIEVVTIGSEYEEDLHPPGTEPRIVEIPPEKPRLSVKERLGCKVDDLDRIVKVDRGYDRNRSSSLSPLSKRAADIGRNYSQGERRVEVDERRRHERRSRSRHGDRDRHSRTYR